MRILSEDSIGSREIGGVKPSDAKEDVYKRQASLLSIATAFWVIPVSSRPNLRPSLEKREK